MKDILPNNPKDRVGNNLLCILGYISAVYAVGSETDIAILVLTAIGPLGFFYYAAPVVKGTGKHMSGSYKANEATTS